MTDSLRNAVYNLFATDATFLSYLADGVNSFVGSDESPEALGDQEDCPWVYLDFMDEVPREDPYSVDGIIRLWAYDEPNAGFVNIHKILMRAIVIVENHIAANDLSTDIALFADPETGEVIIEVSTGGISGPAQDTTLGKLQRWASFPYRKAYQGVAV